MRRKVLVLAAVLTIVASSTAFSWAIGGAFGINPIGGLPGSNVMLTGKFDQSPVIFGVGMRIGQDTFQLGLTGDVHMVRRQLVNFLNFYVGPGLYLGIGNDIQIGGRVPIALYAFPIDVLEVFLEVAPTLAVAFDPIVFPVFGVQGSFGFRFWF